MKNLNDQRFRSKTNASLISVLQRFADVTVIFLGLYGVYYSNDKTFSYYQLIIFLFIFSIFQMIGGITDFYRSWRGVKFSTEMSFIFKNWTISILI